MRRKSTGPKAPSDPFDIINDMGAERLQTFAGIVIGWNIIENYIDNTVGAALKIDRELFPHVYSRINGMDGKIAVIREVLASANANEVTRLPLSKTLNAVESYKRLRDGIVHVRVVDPKAIVADTIQRKGVSDEVLISQEALDALFERLSYLQAECGEMLLIFVHAAIGEFSRDDDKIEQALEHCRKSLAQLLEYQKQREALKPLPKFPDEVLVPEELVGAPAPRG